MIKRCGIYLVVLWFTMVLSVTSPALGETINVGTDGAYSPWNYHGVDGRLKGFDVDVMEEIGRRENFQIHWFETTFQDLLIGIKNKEFDAIISAVTTIDERKKDMSFSDPYAYIYHEVIGYRGDHYSNNKPWSELKKEFKGKKIGVIAGSVHEKYLKRHFRGKVKVITYKDNKLYDDLLAGKLDGVFVGGVSGKAFLDEHGDEYKVIGPKITGKDDPNLTGNIAIAVRKDRPDLLKKINDGLRSMKSDGTLRAIMLRDLGVDLSSHLAK